MKLLELFPMPTMFRMRLLPARVTSGTCLSTVRRTNVS